MDAELKQHLIKYLNNLENVAAKAGDFAAEKVPETLMQYVRWKTYENGMCIIFCAIGTLILLILTIYTVREINRKVEGEDRYFGYALTGFSSILLSIPVVGTFISSSSLFLKCYLAPNIVVIEWLRDLVK